MAKALAVFVFLMFAFMGPVADSFARIAFFEDFDDGVADGFEEVGGRWEISRGGYFQPTEDPPGPYRSWVNAGGFREYTLEVDCNPVSGEQTKVIYAHADTSEEYRVDFWLDRCRLCMPAWARDGLPGTGPWRDCLTPTR